MLNKTVISLGVFSLCLSLGNASISEDSIHAKVLIGWNCGIYSWDRDKISSWGRSPSTWGYYVKGIGEYGSKNKIYISRVELTKSLLYKYGVIIGSALDDYKKGASLADNITGKTPTRYAEKIYAGSLLANRDSVGAYIGRKVWDYKNCSINAFVGVSSKNIASYFWNDLGSIVITVSKNTTHGQTANTAKIERINLRAMKSFCNVCFVNANFEMIFSLNKTRISANSLIGVSCGDASVDYYYNSKDSNTWNKWHVDIDNVYINFMQSFELEYSISNDYKLGASLFYEISKFDIDSASKMRGAIPWWNVFNSNRDSVSNELTSPSFYWIDTEMSKRGAIYVPSHIVGLQLLFATNLG